MNKFPNAKPLAGALAAALLAVASGSAMAIEFQKGELSGNFDTTISYGASWRMEDRDDNNVAKAVHNPIIFNQFLFDNADHRAALGRFSNNSDDGNLKYDDGDLISHTIKITQELDLSWRNFGAFTRWNYFYDFENEGRDDMTDRANDLIGSDFRMLDVYVWGDHEVGNHFLSWRLGQQAISWGESTFIQGGINVINPVDVSKLRIAGAELKEAFLPIEMGWLTFDLTENLSFEALYMFEWEAIDPDPAGSYFSTNDLATPGASYGMLGFGLYPQPVINADLYQGACLVGNTASDQALPPELWGVGCALALPRVEDQYADDGGQYGLAFRYFAPQLNDTEFGFYYLNYHSRLPLISGNTVTNSNPSSASYFIEYPEDISLVGISFNTTIGTYSVAGEWSYRRNQPLQIDDVEVLFAGLTPLNAAVPAPVLRFQSQLGEYGPNEPIQGWERHNVNQFQTTITKLFGPNNFFGADQIAALMELGVTYVPDLPDQDSLRYNGPGTDTGGGADYLTGSFRNPITETGGFAEDLSWGYRFVTRLDYNNAFGTSFTLSPRLGFNHDVSGTAPGPGGNFIEDRKSITLGLGLNYLQKWIFDLSYTSFSGAGHYNQIRDRDFLSASVRYSF